MSRRTPAPSSDTNVAVVNDRESFHLYGDSTHFRIRRNVRENQEDTEEITIEYDSSNSLFRLDVIGAHGESISSVEAATFHLNLNPISAQEMARRRPPPSARNPGPAPVSMRPPPRPPTLTTRNSSRRRRATIEEDRQNSRDGDRRTSNPNLRRVLGLVPPSRRATVPPTNRVGVVDFRGMTPTIPGNEPEPAFSGNLGLRPRPGEEDRRFITPRDDREERRTGANGRLNLLERG